MKTNEERIQDILQQLAQTSYIKPESIPNIDLYMDQVTTFMDEHLRVTKRYEDDKVLTKTMINNYAKNNLLPAPNKKKYSREHMLLLIFIYYFKNLLSFNDIEQLLYPLTELHFNQKDNLPLEDIYKGIFSMEAEEMEHLNADLVHKFEHAQQMFGGENAKEEDSEYLKLYAFICELSFDVYMKKQIIEQIIDDLRVELPPKKKK